MMRWIAQGKRPANHKAKEQSSMFTQRRNRNMVEAAFTTLALIYHVTVNNLRKGQRNAIVGLIMTVFQSIAMIADIFEGRMVPMTLEGIDRGMRELGR